ncbi:hypothetical protein BLNAU_12427 [Blattamonas nauphoetae]|uniref:Uncharacterized protein n=1 Tax=Blattamonas nauphoetae TaxID=2049346 RepID=A0ABQ9XP75_9EUKA|nr:hypothetical protein BLNAU_12427 [Blattamonas nauphoetae]
MNLVLETINTSTDSPRPDISSHSFPCPPGCSPFLYWNQEKLVTDIEKAVVFRSLVATMKLQHTFDDSLEAKAVHFLRSVDPDDEESVDSILKIFASNSDKSLTDFVQSIVVLISSTNLAITTTVLGILDSMIIWCSSKIRLPLIKADLIHQILNTLKPLSLSFAEAEDVHVNIMERIHHSIWLATPNGHRQLEIEDVNEQKDVRETVFLQVVTPSEHYIRHLCENRYSIIDGDQSKHFLALLTRLLQISPYHQQTMTFVLNMPVFLPITSCLTFIEDDDSVWRFLNEMNDAQRGWNKQGGNQRQLVNEVCQMLRLEGIEDVMEAKQRNDQNRSNGGGIVGNSMELNNLNGINLPQL